MSRRPLAIIFVLFFGSLIAAAEPEPWPKDVPPVLGTALAQDSGKTGASAAWTIKLTLPKIAWEVAGEVVPKQEWPELKTQVEKVALTLRMGGPSALAESRVVDLQGKQLRREQIVEQLKRETPVFVSVSGRMPDAYFLQLAKPDALIVILGPRDGLPAPEFLPAKKTPSAPANSSANPTGRASSAAEPLVRRLALGRLQYIMTGAFTP